MTGVAAFRMVRIAGVAAAVVLLAFADASAQRSHTTTASTGPAKLDESHSRPAVTPPEDADPYFKEIYRRFYDSYKLGPEDEIAVRLLGQPDYTLEKVQVSPFGRIYHPLIGEMEVAGLTVSMLTRRLMMEFSQYILDPNVSVSLLSANSAKVGVLGEVARPGIIVMARPMTMLDAISATGGVTDYGSKTSVTVLRQVGGGRMQTMTVNVKRILEGKPDAGEENITLQAGDTVVVHGNFKKTFATITQLAGFGYFVKTLAGR